MASSHLKLFVAVVLFQARHSSSYPIGMNIGLSVYWSGQGIYCDLIKQAEYPFGSVEKPFDKSQDCLNGTECTAMMWPVGEYGIWIDDIDTTDSGVYQLRANGNASVDARPYALSDEHYDAETNVFTALLTVTTKGILALKITSPSSGGFTNVSLREPQCARDASFHPNYLRVLKQSVGVGVTEMVAGPLRTMSAVNAIQSGQTTWSTRTPIWSPTWNVNPTIPAVISYGQKEYDTATPWEALIELANEADRDLWVNIPPNATQDYVVGLASLLKNTLQPHLNIYIEYANEVWNWMFKVAHWNLNEAIAEVAAGDKAHLNFDNCNNQGYWAWRRVTWKLLTILESFDLVFGSEQRNVRFRGVYAAQIGGGVGNGDWSGGSAAEALKYVRNIYGRPGKFIYALSGAPYFGLGKATHYDNLTAAMVLAVSEEVIDSMIPNIGNNFTSSSLITYGAMAQWNGLRFVGYEGGPDYSGDLVAPGANRSIPQSNIDAKIYARRSTQQTVLDKKYLDGLQGAGMQFLSWFGAFVGSYNTSITYSCLENLADNVNNSSILRGIAMGAASPVPTLTAGVPMHSSSDITVAGGGSGGSGGEDRVSSSIKNITTITNTTNTTTTTTNTPSTTNTVVEASWNFNTMSSATIYGAKQGACANCDGAPCFRCLTIDTSGPATPVNPTVPPDNLALVWLANTGSDGENTGSDGENKHGERRVQPPVNFALNMSISAPIHLDVWLDGTFVGSMLCPNTTTSTRSITDTTDNEGAGAVYRFTPIVKLQPSRRTVVVGVVFRNTTVENLNLILVGINWA